MLKLIFKDVFTNTPKINIGKKCTIFSKGHDEDGYREI